MASIDGITIYIQKQTREIKVKHAIHLIPNRRLPLVQPTYIASPTWTIEATVPADINNLRDLQNTAHKMALVTFVDEFGNSYNVRVMTLDIKETAGQQNIFEIELTLVEP